MDHFIVAMATFRHLQLASTVSSVFRNPCLVSFPSQEYLAAEMEVRLLAEVLHGEHFSL